MNKVWDKIKRGWDFFLIMFVVLPIVFILYPSWKKDFENEEEAENYHKHHDKPT